MLYTLTSRISGDGAVAMQTILFIVSAVVGANLGMALFRRLYSKSAKEDANNTTGIFFGAISVLYSLILAFVIMAQWDSFNELNETVAAESDKLNSILSHSAALPDEMKRTIGNSLAAYCNEVMNNEWGMQDRDSANRPSAIPALRHLLLTTMPANSLHEAVLNVMDKDLSAISDLRRARLAHTHSQLPSLVWIILAFGAVLLVVFCYFFQVCSVRMQSVCLSFFVCLLAMCLSIVYNLDHPFAPGSRLDNSAYQKVLSELPRILHR